MVINEVKSLFKGTDDKQKDFGWYEFTLEEAKLEILPFDENCQAR